MYRRPLSFLSFAFVRCWHQASTESSHRDQIMGDESRDHQGLVDTRPGRICAEEDGRTRMERVREMRQKEVGTRSVKKEATNQPHLTAVSFAHHRRIREREREMSSPLPLQPSAKRRGRRREDCEWAPSACRQCLPDKGGVSCKLDMLETRACCKGVLQWDSEEANLGCRPRS